MNSHLSLVFMMLFFVSTAFAQEVLPLPDDYPGTGSSSSNQQSQTPPTEMPQVEPPTKQDTQTDSSVTAAPESQQTPTPKLAESLPPKTEQQPQSSNGLTSSQRPGSKPPVQSVESKTPSIHYTPDPKTVNTEPKVSQTPTPSKKPIPTPKKQSPPATPKKQTSVKSHSPPMPAPTPTPAAPKAPSPQVKAAPQGVTDVAFTNWVFYLKPCIEHFHRQGTPICPIYAPASLIQFGFLEPSIHSGLVEFDHATVVIGNDITRDIYYGTFAPSIRAKTGVESTLCIRETYQRDTCRIGSRKVLLNVRKKLLRP